jgi:cellulose synthase/poly-beta-1,6-N-acetylglucosamine synthase-like glycosyltransferase
MAFKAEVLRFLGWNAFSLAEDVQYFMRLVNQGVQVDFAADAIVSSPMPDSLQDAKSQNLRWEKGRFLMALRYGPRFLFEGLLSRDPRKVDAALEQFLPPLSFVAVTGILLLLSALLLDGPGLFWTVLFANITMTSSIILGLISAKVPLQTYPALLYAPFFIVWKVWVYAFALASRDLEWIRTKRSF